MSNNTQPYALVFGVSVFDIFGFTNNNYRCNDSNPGRVRTSFGGVSRNIAENMARVGVNTKFISILGDDETGKRMIEHSRVMKYDMEDSLIVEGHGTPTYMAILNEKGELESAVVDMKIADMFTKEFIDSKADIIRNSEYMFLDSDMPEILEYILKNFEGQTKFILDPVSAAKAKNILFFEKYEINLKDNGVIIIDNIELNDFKKNVSPKKARFYEGKINELKDYLASLSDFEVSYEDIGDGIAILKSK